MREVVEGVGVEYIREGDGKPVLMLHGYGGEINSFAPVINFLIDRGNQVIAIDFPGYGKSDQPLEAWSITEYADNLYKFLKQIGIEKIDVVAHSFGARIAIILSSEHPEIIDKMVFTGAAGILPKRKLTYYFKTYSYKLGKFLSKNKFLDKKLKISEHQKNAGSDEYRLLSGVMRTTYVKVVNQNLRPFLPEIKAPTLLIWGEDDTSTPLWMGETMKKEIPDAGLVVFENAGHFAYLEKCDRFCSIIDSFLWR